MNTNERMLRREEVAVMVNLSIPSLYRLMAQDLFPRPRKIGIRAVRWRESDIREFLDSRPVATGEVGQAPDAA